MPIGYSLIDSIKISGEHHVPATVRRTPNAEKPYEVIVLANVRLRVPALLLGNDRDGRLAERQHMADSR